jgi:hypothetical protein
MMGLDPSRQGLLEQVLLGTHPAQGQLGQNGWIHLFLEQAFQ